VRGAGRVQAKTREVWVVGLWRRRRPSRRWTEPRGPAGRKGGLWSFGAENTDVVGQDTFGEDPKTSPSPGKN